MPLTLTNEADKTPLPEDIQARRERILVVEDDTDLQRMLAFTLTRLGYQVQTATDGLHALNMLQEAAPGERAELILTDVQMPGLDGIELLRRVRTDEPDMPVIVMTAFTSNAAIMHALRLHADDFVAKPIEMAELKTALDRALRARRQRIALEAERTRAARLQAVLETATAVNHEINNPLAAISASAQLMRQQLQRNDAVQNDAVQDIVLDGSHNTDSAMADSVSADSVSAAHMSTHSDLTVGTQPDLAALERLLDVIIEQCGRIADFNRKLTGVVNPVTRSSGGHRMLDVDHSLSDRD
ncbi:MAG TPA: response regulator [Abditibacteriaceae bacterium]|jgi:DNA-binding response OmpR family regulator